MRVTTDHPASSYGVPVILDDSGAPLDYHEGVKLIRSRLGFSAADLADRCGVSRRTVEGWEQGRQPTAAALNVMGGLLAPKRGRKKP